MAKINTNIMNDIAESLKDSTKNLPKEEKEKVENEVLQEAQQKIENKQKQIEEATSKTSEELNNYANKVEETENSIVSSASKLDSANEMPKITSTIDLNARNEKIAIKREERKNNSTSSTSSNTSKTSDTKVTEKNVTSSNTNTKTTETSKKTNDTKVVETNEIVDKSSTNNIKNTNITAKEKFKEQQLEEKNSKKNTNTTISQNLKNVEKRIDDIDNKNDLSGFSHSSGKTSKPKVISNEELVVCRSLSLATFCGFIGSGIEALFTGKKFEDVLVKNLNKAVGVTSNIAGAELFVSEGVETLAEDVVKGAIVISEKNSPSSNNKESNSNIESFISNEYTKSKYNDFYTNNIFGSYTRNNITNFDTKRNIGNAVGYSLPAIGAGLATGGVAAPMAIGALSQTGKGTTEALNEGATFKEASTYGELRGALTASTIYAGKAINTLNIFGKGSVEQVLANSISHVALDGGLSAASSLTDTGLKGVYTPRNKLNELGFESEEEWNNAPYSEKYKTLFNQSGGWNTVGKNAISGMAFSAVFEGVSAAKEINDINKASNVYTKLQENNVALKNAIENTDNIDDEIRSATIDRLTTERSSINESYNSLTSNQKYYFELTATKNAINNNSLSSNGINTIINSSNVKNINAGLSKAEQSSLIKQMDDNQLLKFMSKLDIKDARKLVSNNADYFYNRLSNNTSSTWSNSTSLIESKTDLMVVKNTSNSVDSNNVDIIARNKFESRVGDIEADYNEAIDGIIDEYYTSLRPDVAVPKEKRAISVIQKKYGNNSDYEKTINLYYDELDDSAKKLSDSFLETYTTNYDSPTALTSSLLTKTSASKQQLAKKIEEIDSLIEEFKTKAGYDIFGPHRTNVKVYSGLKEDFMDQYKKVESLENSIKTADKKYIDSVVEKGKELLGESDFEKLDKIFHPTKVEQVTEILEGTAIPRGKKLTTEIVKEKVGATNSTSATSKIGFQFFANKKSSGGILSNIFSKKENATDTFFGDFDSKVDTYGTNQEFINNNVRYVINPSNIPFSRSDFYNYLSSRYPNTSLSELKSEWDGLFTGKITVTNPSDIVSYLASRNQRLGKTISQDIDRAVEEFESMSTKYQSSEYIKLQDYLTSKGMTTSESTNLLTFMNTTGVCSYTDIVNEILTSYRNNPKLFRSQFGYGLYTYTDGKKTLNGNQLLLDLYTYANTHYKGKDSFRPLFRESSDGSLHINSLDTSEQVYLEKDDYKIVENFLKSKDESLSYEYKTKMYKPSLDPDKVKYRIKEALKNGNVGITIYSKSQNEKYANNSNIELGEDGSTILYDPTGEYQVDTESWDEGDSHAMLITGLTNKGIIVSSWGKKLVIDYEDLANNFYKLRYSNIGGIE